MEITKGGEIIKTLALRGRVVTAHEVWDGATVLIEGAQIKAISQEPVEADETLEFPNSFLVPGFVDLQINGAFGIDVVLEPERLGELSDKLLRTGTTSYLPTVISLRLDSYPHFLSRVVFSDERCGAEPLGLHLEGPFLNAKKRGAHLAEHIASPNAEALANMLDSELVRMITVAPELLGVDELMDFAASRGVLVSIGHSNASFETAQRAMNLWARSVTHLFNAMSPLHHREPGLPGAALTHPWIVCGIIADGIHVHPKIIDLAYRVLGPDRIYLVTDAIAAAGMQRGEYSLAGQRVFQDEGVPRLESGTLAGSILTMDEALRNIKSFTGCTIAEAVRMATSTPSRIIGEAGSRGRLAPGYCANVVVLSSSLKVEGVWVRGERRVG
jgi:N-acetylglucosamine-6-phosphate deacetylase